MEIFSAPSETAQAPMRFKKKVEFTGRDILPLKEELDALTSRDPMSLVRFILFILFLAIPVIVYMSIRAALVFTKKDDHPSRIMADRAEKALKQASKAGASGEEFLSCLYRALVLIILSKAGIKGESLTYAEAKDILSASGYSDEMAAQAAALLERIESSRYSGLQMDGAFKADLLSETKQLFRNVSR